MSWQEVLGKPDPEWFRGHALVLAAAATGWIGLMAAVVAPALRNRFYLSFSILLVFYGFLSTLRIARNLTNPVTWQAVKLDAMLSELKALRSNNRAPNKDSDDQEPSSARNNDD
jgi:hypothetical protein